MSTTDQILSGSLLVIKGISKKTGREYERLVVGKNDQFNPTIIAYARQQGVKTLDLTGEKAVLVA